MKIVSLVLQGVLIVILAVTLATGINTYAAFACLFIFSTILLALQTIANSIYLWKAKKESIKKSVLIYFIILVLCLIGIFVINSIKSIHVHIRDIIAEISLIALGLNMLYNYVLYWVFYKIKD